MSIPTIPTPRDKSRGELAAWYGMNGFCEHYRKVMLAACAEDVRVRLVGQKLTEARVLDLARTHPTYLAFLENHLKGRALFETMAEGRWQGAAGGPI